MVVNILSQYVSKLYWKQQRASGHPVLMNASFPSRTAFISVAGIDLWKGKQVMWIFPVTWRRQYNSHAIEQN